MIGGTEFTYGRAVLENQRGGEMKGSGEARRQNAGSQIAASGSEMLLGELASSEPLPTATIGKPSAQSHSMMRGREGAQRQSRIAGPARDGMK